MLGTLKLDNFRGFDAYELTDLTRVNLLVGKNNCGKTSILEAIHLLVSGGDPLVLVRMANRQGEVSDTDAASGRGWEPDISHFFSGHRVTPGMGFRLSSGDGNGTYGQVSVMVEHAALEDPVQRDLGQKYAATLGNTASDYASDQRAPFMNPARADALQSRCGSWVGRILTQYEPSLASKTIVDVKRGSLNAAKRLMDWARASPVSGFPDGQKKEGYEVPHRDMKPVVESTTAPLVATDNDLRRPLPIRRGWCCES